MANIKEQAAAVNMLPNARLTAAQVINSVFKDGAYANIALGKALSKQNHSEQDRRFVTELVYGTVKAKGTIDWLLQQLVSRPLGKIEPMILNILRLGVFQIYFLERIPASAACNESVNLAKKFGHEGIVKFVNGVLRGAVRSKESIDTWDNTAGRNRHVPATHIQRIFLMQELQCADNGVKIKHRFAAAHNDNTADLLTFSDQHTVKNINLC